MIDNTKMTNVKCPLCGKLLANMSQHLLHKHGVANLRERQLWMAFARRKVTKPFHPCPLCGRVLKHIRPHLANTHAELSVKGLARATREFQMDVTVERLRDLEASNPEVPLVTLGILSEQHDDEGIPSAPSTPAAVSSTPPPFIAPSSTPSPPPSLGTSAAVEDFEVELEEFLEGIDIPGVSSEGGPLFGETHQATTAGLAMEAFLSEERVTLSTVHVDASFLRMLEDNSGDPLMFTENQFFK
nr:uncharacterized protein LOC129446121 [Misgurnus anguillicaudatus]